MNKLKIEMLSALIDGEHDHASGSVIEDLCKDEDLRQTWARFHLVSDSLKGHLPTHINMDVINRIHDALQDEPAILAPTNHVRSYLKPVAGFAIAASVAVVAILGIQHNNSGLDVSGKTEQLAVNRPEQAGTQQFTFVPSQPVLQVQTVSTEKVNAKSRMNSYLVNYNEQRANAGMQGIFPYVRIVAHEKQE